MNNTTKEIIKTAVFAMEEKKAENIKALDISEVTVIADCFIICNGNNMPQVEAITDNVLDTLAKSGLHPKRIEGHHISGWVLLDFGDVVIHVFNKDDRVFYDLEHIWRDGKSIDVDTL